MATPSGTAAIAVVRASGPDVKPLVRALFGRIPPPRQACHADYRNGRDILLDDVLFTFFAMPGSYTGEDSVEISCHGNPLIASKILNDLFARGCRPAEPGEFTRRAFLNGRFDLSQAEAVMDLIHARSERALVAANRQLRGSVGKHTQEIIDRLLKIIAQVEAYIDFPEEDLPDRDRIALRRALGEVLAGLERLIASNRYGELLRNGIRLVIVGATNAGKSSVLNRLVGRERALVSPEPGTTRDYLEDELVIEDHYFRIVDTAGFNSSPSSLERLGISKTFEQAASADLLLWIVDSTLPPPLLPPEIAAVMQPANTVIVLNKSDLAGASVANPNRDLESVAVSALTGDGFILLLRELVRLAEAFRIEVGDETITVNVRHKRALETAKKAISTVIEKLEVSEADEFIASDLRCALDALGEIAGRIDNERVLDELFSTFCIGK